jgi:hypothetical protein
MVISTPYFSKVICVSGVFQLDLFVFFTEFQITEYDFRQEILTHSKRQLSECQNPHTQQAKCLSHYVTILSRAGTLQGNN